MNDSNPSMFNTGRPIGAFIARAAVAILLIVAAALKAWELATSIPDKSSLSIAAILVEAPLALWLLSGRNAAVSIRCALVLFFVFLGVNLTSVHHGTANCGCFGPILVSPLISAGIDGAAILGCLYVIGGKWGSPRMIFALMLGLAALIGAVGWLSPDATHNPMQWVGRNWPVGMQVDIGDDLTQGRWVVMLYSSECGRCRGALEIMNDNSKIWRSKTVPVQSAIIDADGFESDQKKTGIEQVAKGCLRQEHPQWPLPVFLFMDQGKILRVTREIPDPIDTFPIAAL